MVPSNTEDKCTRKATRPRHLSSSPIYIYKRLNFHSRFFHFEAAEVADVQFVPAVQVAAELGGALRAVGALPVPRGFPVPAAAPAGPLAHGRAGVGRLL